MKNLLIVSLILSISAGASMAAIPWWEQPTVCRVSPSNCYPSMGAGYDSSMWDVGSNCWGQKMICPEATIAQNDSPVAMERGEIARGTGIKQDFDTNVLNGDCFGVRKTINNGSMASVDGKFVNVWCNGVLDNVDEVLPNGEISFSANPSCTELADNGYIAVLNQRCYGKYYDTAQYYIECDAAGLLPARLIVLNGANYETTATNVPADQRAADAIFDTMHQASSAQHDKYFTK